MGMDGGVRIVKIEDVKQNWTTIKEQLISWSIPQSYTDKWDIPTLNELHEVCKQLPDYISDLDYPNIINLLKPFKWCDSPYLYEDNIIVSMGDNISCEADVLYEALGLIENVDIETWT